MRANRAQNGDFRVWLPTSDDGVAVVPYRGCVALRGLVAPRRHHPTLIAFTFVTKWSWWAYGERETHYSVDSSGLKMLWMPNCKKSNLFPRWLTITPFFQMEKSETEFTSVVAPIDITTLCTPKVEYRVWSFGQPGSDRPDATNTN
jgi:hypothetical protein